MVHCLKDQISSRVVHFFSFPDLQTVWALLFSALNTDLDLFLDATCTNFEIINQIETVPLIETILMSCCLLGFKSLTC